MSKIEVKNQKKTIVRLTISTLAFLILALLPFLGVLQGSVGLWPTQVTQQFLIMLSVVSIAIQGVSIVLIKGGWKTIPIITLLLTVLFLMQYISYSAANS